MSNVHSEHNIEKIEEAISSLEALNKLLNDTYCHLDEVIALLHTLDIVYTAGVVRNYEKLVYEIKEAMNWNHNEISHLRSMREALV